MRGVWPHLAALVVAGALCFGFVSIDTDARAIFGSKQDLAGSLDTVEGRRQLIALVDPNQTRRHANVLQVAKTLRESPLVARVSTGREMPPPDVLDWMWRHRFALSPVAPDAVSPDAVESEMQAARAALTDLRRAAFAQYYLRDPTGSFRRLTTSLFEAAHARRDRAGLWAGHAPDTNLIFVDLADRPFEVAAQAALDAKIRSVAVGSDTLMLGPRSITASISGDIAWRSQVFALLATGLLLIWLVLVLRSLRGLSLCFLPLALGVALATLGVAGIFGSIHVIAIGFGAALVGLALDYPLHIMAHGAEAATRRHAHRLIVIGALTTAIGFMAMAGAGIQALAQVGVFVATGLLVAALTSVSLGPALPTVSTGFARLDLHPRPISGRTGLLLGLAGILAASMFLTIDRRDAPLVMLPAAAQQSIERLATLVDLPSAQHQVEVTGTTLTEVLDRQNALMPQLDRLIETGALSRYDAIASVLPHRTAPNTRLPATTARQLAEALAGAGVAAGFIDTILADFEAAQAAAQPTPDELTPILAQTGLAALISTNEGMIRAPVHLFGVDRPEEIAAVVKAAALPGTGYTDVRAEITGRLSHLTDRALLCLSAGLVLGLSALAALTRSLATTRAVALPASVATLGAALLSSAVFGGLGVFQIIALALIMGLGIDYGLFMATARTAAARQAAARSILLCAVTTLTAFATMIASGVNVLEEIGVTVSAGVLIMLVLSMSYSPDSHGETT